MPFTLNSYLTNQGESNLYLKEFSNTLENHVQLLRTTFSTQVVSLIPHDEYRFEGDFYGLLHSMNIPPDMHWIILRVNNLHSPLAYRGGMRTLLIPARDFIIKLLTKHINKTTLR